MFHEMPNDLRLRILGNKEILGNLKTTWGHSLVPSLPWRNKFLVMELRKHAETVSFSFQFCVTLLDFSIFLKILCT